MTYKIKDLCQQIVCHVAHGNSLGEAKQLLESTVILNRVATYKIPRDESEYEYCWTVVHAACRYNTADDILRVLLTDSCAIDSPDEMRRCPIWYAARYGHKKLVAHLIDLRAKVRSRDVCGWSALHAAASNGHVEVCDILLQCGASFEDVDNAGWSPFHKAVWNGHETVAKILLGRPHTCDTSSTFEGNINALHLAVLRKHVGLVRVLNRRLPVLTNMADRNGVTALMISCQRRSHDVAKMLLKGGADVCKKTSNGWNALHYAVQARDLKCMGLLLNYGVRFDEANHNGVTPFLFASRVGFVEGLMLLHRCEADLTVTTARGCSALHLATMGGHVDCVAFLIKQLKFDVHAVDGNLNTALHYAALRNHFAICSLLLGCGGLPCALNNSGQSSVHIASVMRHIGMVQLLVLFGGSIWHTKPLFFPSSLPNCRGAPQTHHRLPHSTVRPFELSYDLSV